MTDFRHWIANDAVAPKGEWSKITRPYWEEYKRQFALLETRLDELVPRRRGETRFASRDDFAKFIAEHFMEFPIAAAQVMNTFVELDYAAGTEDARRLRIGLAGGYEYADKRIAAWTVSR